MTWQRRKAHLVGIENDLHVSGVPLNSNSRNIFLLPGLRLFEWHNSPVEVLIGHCMLRIPFCVCAAAALFLMIACRAPRPSSEALQAWNTHDLHPKRLQWDSHDQ